MSASTRLEARGLGGFAAVGSGGRGGRTGEGCPTKIGLLACSRGKFFLILSKTLLVRRLARGMRSNYLFDPPAFADQQIEESNLAGWVNFKNHPKSMQTAFGE